MLTRRIIPCLDIKNGRTVKGVNFLGLRDAGDPIELARRYEAEGADELVFLDITATLEKRRTLVDLVERIARQLSIPFTVGGGIGSVEEIRELLQAGADKVSLNSSIVRRPELITEASDRFGAQCIVAAIDVKQTGTESWTVFVKGGTEATALDALAWIQEVERRGAGELLVTSMDRDGTKSGYDARLLNVIQSVSSLPLIASGGAGSMEDCRIALESGADAVLAASIFHFREIEIAALKAHLTRAGLAVRRSA